MLFTNIAQLCAKGVEVTIKVSSAQDGQLQVIVTPTSKVINQALIAKSFEATAEELDRDFPTVMLAYAGANGNLVDSIKAIEKEASQAEQAAKDAAAAKAAVRKAIPAKTAGKASPTVLELSAGDGLDPDDDDDATPGASPQQADAGLSGKAQSEAFTL